MLRKGSGFVWVLTLALLLSACGPTKPADQTTAPPTQQGGAGQGQGTPSQTTKVAVGVTAQLSDAGIYIGIEKGYFKEQGIEVDLPAFSNGNDVIPALATDRIQVARAAFTAGLFNSLLNDINLRVVGDGGNTAKGYGYLAIAVRKDLVDSGAVKTPKDLKGHTVGLAAPGGSSELLLDMVLKQGGLTQNDISVKGLAFPDMLAAFANKGLDAAVVTEPTLSAGIDKQLITKVWSGDELYPDMQTAVLIFSPTFVKNRDAAQRFATAYLKALRDYNDAFGPKHKGYDEVVKMLTKYTAIKDPAVYSKMVPVGLNPDGKVNQAGMESDLKWYMDKGLVKKKVDLQQAVDNSFMENALKVLGPYKP